MTAPECRVSHEALRLRSRALKNIREFLYQRGYIEVETPKISRFATVDRHIESVTAQPTADSSSFLITSPEYHMKRLLISGSGNIFQLGRVFRRDELGSLHNVEFTMLEWYKVDCHETEFMAEIESLLQNLLRIQCRFPRTTYREAMRRHTGIDPFTLRKKEFVAFCRRNNHHPSEELLRSDNIDECLDYLMGFFVEPRLGRDAPEFITCYPSAQATLARLHDGEQTARRFELYYRGVELCNGSNELRHQSSYKERFDNENQARRKAGLPTRPIDENLMEGLRAGLPQCCGAALGIDRLLMTMAEKNNLREVIAFPFDSA